MAPTTAWSSGRGGAGRAQSLVSWLPPSLRHHLIGETRVLETRLTQGWCVTRLQEQVGGPWSGRPLIGSVELTAFGVTRWPPTLGLFDLRAFGEFLPTRVGTRVRVRMAMHPLMLAPIVFILAGIALLSSWVIVRWATGRPLGTTDLAVVVFVLSILPWLPLSIVRGWQRAPTWDPVLWELLRETLQAEEVPDD